MAREREIGWAFLPAFLPLSPPAAPTFSLGESALAEGSTQWHRSNPWLDDWDSYQTHTHTFILKGRVSTSVCMSVCAIGMAQPHGLNRLNMIEPCFKKIPTHVRIRILRAATWDSTNWMPFPHPFFFQSYIKRLGGNQVLVVYCTSNYLHSHSFAISVCMILLFLLFLFSKFGFLLANTSKDWFLFFHNPSEKNSQKMSLWEVSYVITKDLSVLATATSALTPSTDLNIWSVKKILIQTRMVALLYTRVVFVCEDIC